MNKPGKRVLTFGVFDYFHLGHLRLFKRCREYGDYLIVGIQRDAFAKQLKPDQELFYSTEERIELVESIHIVDEVFAYDMLSPATMEMVSFDTLALGEEHVGGRFDVIEKWCKDHGKSVVRIDRTPGISSSAIRKDVIRKYSRERGKKDE